MFSASIADCKAACCAREWCNSFDYYKGQNKCDLSNAPKSKALRTNYPNHPYDHYQCITCTGGYNAKGPPSYRPEPSPAWLHSPCLLFHLHGNARVMDQGWGQGLESVSVLHECFMRSEMSPNSNRVLTLTASATNPSLTPFTQHPQNRGKACGLYSGSVQHPQWLV